MSRFMACARAIAKTATPSECLADPRSLRSSASHRPSSVAEECWPGITIGAMLHRSAHGPPRYFFETCRSNDEFDVHTRIVQRRQRDAAVFSAGWPGALFQPAKLQCFERLVAGSCESKNCRFLRMRIVIRSGSSIIAVLPYSASRFAHSQKGRTNDHRESKQATSFEEYFDRAVSSSFECRISPR